MDLLLPAGLTSRPCTMDDVDLATTLAQAYEREFLGRSVVEAGDIRAHWSRPSLDLEADTVLVLDGDTAVAWAEVDRGVYADVGVAGTHRGRGIGTALERWVTGRLGEVGSTRVVQECAEDDAGSAAFFAAHGYRHSYTSWLLRLDADATIAGRELAPGLTVRHAEPDEARIVWQVVEDAFGEWEGRPPGSYADWRALVVERPHFTWEHVLVAVDAGEVVGACVTDEGEADECWVNQLAVRADHRGRGLAQQMLARAYEAWRDRGKSVGMLSTDSRTGALTLYERLGMHVTQTFLSWEKSLR